MLVKIHEAYRTIVAVCDSDLIDKKFEEESMQIDLTGQFFKGDEKTEEEVQEIIDDLKTEDATFYFVGKQTCGLALKIGIIEESGIMKIQNVPVALSLL